MTPTSALAGVLTGLVDGLIVGIAIFLILALDRRRRSVPVEVKPVADDRQSDRPLSPEGNLHRAA